MWYDEQLEGEMADTTTGAETVSGQLVEEFAARCSPLSRKPRWPS
jgi:hypothetical protein